MKRFLILFLCAFTTDSLASGIASNTNSAPCTNNTLETYSGNSNLTADWQANEIQLRWYNMNTQITPTNTDANTCTYDGSLAIPQNAPTRTGYTFAGWEVVPQYDFSTLNAETNGIHAWSKLSSENCWYGAGSTHSVPCNNGDFDDLNVKEWKVSFDYGTIYGSQLCSSTIGELYKPGTPEKSSTGEYCWCKVTGFIPTNSDIKYKPTKSTNWVYIRVMSTGCGGCADYCSAYFVRLVELRRSMFN